MPLVNARLPTAESPAQARLQRQLDEFFRPLVTEVNRLGSLTSSLVTTGSVATSLRLQSAASIDAVDDSLGEIEFYSRDASANSTGVFGKIGVYNEFPGSWDGTLSRVDTYMALSASKDGVIGERLRLDGSSVKAFGALRVDAAATDEVARLDTSGNCYLSFCRSTAREAYIQIDSTNGLLIISEINKPMRFRTNNIERGRFTEGGDFVLNLQSTAPSLTANYEAVFNLTSDTNLRISVRGSDGTTRVANITLA